MVPQRSAAAAATTEEEGIDALLCTLEAPSHAPRRLEPACLAHEAAPDRRGGQRGAPSPPSPPQARPGRLPRAARGRRRRRPRPDLRLRPPVVPARRDAAGQERLGGAPPGAA